MNEVRQSKSQARFFGRSFIVYAAVTLLACGAAVWYWPATCNTGRSPEYCATDFYMFWVVNQIRETHPDTAIYSAEESVRQGRMWHDTALKGDSIRLKVAVRDYEVLEPISTPFLYASLAPFAGGSYEADSFVFYLVSTTLAAVSLFFIMRAANFGTFPAVLILAGVAVWFEPFKSELRVGNVTRLQLAVWGCLIGALFIKRRGLRWVSAGGIAAVFVIFKPTTVVLPVLMAIYLAAGGLWGALAGFCLSFIFSGALCFWYAAWFFGSWQIWPQWLEAIGGRFSSGFTIQNGRGNFSLQSLLEEFMPVYGTTVAAALIPSLLLAGFISAWKFGKSRAAENDARGLFFLCSFSLITSLLISKPLWLYYYLLILPFCFLVLAPQKGKLSAAGRAGRGLVVSALIIASGLIFPVLEGLGLYSFYSFALLYTAATIMLYVAGILYMWRRPVT